MPIPLRAPETGVNFGRMEDHITLKINGGPRPDTGRAVLVLGFGHGVPAGACDNLGVRLNTHPVSACKEPEYDSISTAHRDRPRHDWEYDFIEIARFFDLLFDGDNVFEFIPPQVDGRLEWAEVLVLPADRCKQEACLPN